MLSQPDPKSGSTSGGDRPRKRDRELARLGGHNDGNLATCENPDGSSGGLRSGAKFRGIDPGNRKRLRHASSAVAGTLQLTDTQLAGCCEYFNAVKVK